MWHWLLTSTTYGTWLPGDPRGSVTSVRDYRPTDGATTKRVEHDRPGEPWEPPALGLQRSAMSRLKDPVILLTKEQAEVVLDEFLRTAEFKGWRILAAAIMSNHFHVVVSLTDDVDPSRLLQEFKSYGSRALNARFGKPRSGTWWTKSGSTRKLPDEASVHAATNYVLRKQPNPLAVWPTPAHDD